MTFGELSRIIRRRNNSNGISSDQPLTPEQLEIEESRALLQQLHENYIKAYKRHKEKWIEEHPDQKYFSPTLEEHKRDCEVDEWFWYFIKRVTTRTPQQRYQDEKNPDYGWNHSSPYN